MRKTAAIVVLVAVWTLAQAPADGKVAIVTLAELERDAGFIGIVRVGRISVGIPLVRRPRAKAVILESWKGLREGGVTFVAAPAWTCDISEAKNGEQAVVFVRGGSLLHSGRGSMPIFTRDGKRLAAVWPEVRLPAGVTTEDGPEPEYRFIRAVGLNDLRIAIVGL